MNMFKVYTRREIHPTEIEYVKHLHKGVILRRLDEIHIQIKRRSWYDRCELADRVVRIVSCPAMILHTVFPKKHAHGFVVLCFVVVMQSFIMNSHEVFIHIHQGCFAGTGAIVRLPQCQWSKPDGNGKINQCITTTKHSKAKTVCIFLGIYCRK